MHILKGQLIMEHQNKYIEAYPSFDAATFLELPIKNIIIISHSSHHPYHQTDFRLPTSDLQNNLLTITIQGSPPKQNTFWTRNLPLFQEH